MLSQLILIFEDDIENMQTADWLNRQLSNYRKDLLTKPNFDGILGICLKKIYLFTASCK